MDKAKYASDLKEIKDIMSRSTQFLSLSGLSGISTGFIALVGAFIAYKKVFEDQAYLTHHAVAPQEGDLLYLLGISIGTLVLSICSAIYFTHRKTILQNNRVWDIPTQRMMVNLFIPLVAGGILCLMLLTKGFIGMVPAMTLIFYGMALVNGSKYTLPEIRNLGLIQMIIGLLAFHFIEYALLLWALGFGIAQMMYGLLIQRKY